MAYKKINGVIRSKGESIYAKMVFSDYMYKYDANMEKSRVIMLITDSSLYVMSLNNYSVINHAQLADLEQILSIQSNSNIFALNFKNANDLLMESMRRTELIIFLLNNADNDPDRQRPIIKRPEKIRLQSRLKEVNKKIVSFDEQKEQDTKAAYMDLLRQTDAGASSFILSYKYGYLCKRSKTWYKSWVEKFYVLTNIGLIYMESPDDKEVKLYPTIDFEVVGVDEKVYGK